MNGYIIFYDEEIGKGQFGTVVKAQLASDLMPSASQNKDGKKVIRSTIDQTKPVYACKIFETEKFNEEDMQHVFKEINIHSMVQSDNAIKHYQAIKTSNKVYLIQEYANSFDLACLMEVRGGLT